MIHYDPLKWTSHLFDVEGSMVREIMGRVSACVGWSALVVVFHFYVHKLDGTTIIHMLVGLALGLLLVFRTNSSNERFWEGRKLWGSITNESRNLARMAEAYVRPKAPDLADEILLWAIVFPRAVRNELRDPQPFGKAFALLPPEETRGVVEAVNTPLAVSLKITELLAEANRRGVISDIVLSMIDQNVQQNIDSYGGCARIRKTPLPFVYVVHLRRCLIVYCFSLPLAIVATHGWWTVPVTLILAYTFFGIEEIGVEIEDPFGQDLNDLPLNQFCDDIEKELLALRSS